MDAAFNMKNKKSERQDKCINMTKKTDEQFVYLTTISIIQRWW